jgi:hypothetical protein
LKLPSKDNSKFPNLIYLDCVAMSKRLNAKKIRELLILLERAPRDLNPLESIISLEGNIQLSNFDHEI